MKPHPLNFVAISNHIIVLFVVVATITDDGMFCQSRVLPNLVLPASQNCDRSFSKKFIAANNLNMTFARQAFSGFSLRIVTAFGFVGQWPCPLIGFGFAPLISQQSSVCFCSLLEGF